MKQRKAKRERRVAGQRKTHVPDAADCLSKEPRTSKEQTDRAWVNPEPPNKIEVELEGFCFVIERTGVPRERFYSVKELAEKWGVSRDTIRRRFANEPGVIVISNSVGDRPYRTLRIPPDVADRVRNK